MLFETVLSARCAPFFLPEQAPMGASARVTALKETLIYSRVCA